MQTFPKNLIDRSFRLTIYLVCIYAFINIPIQGLHADTLDHILARQKVFGDFKGWMVSSGETVDGALYCDMTSSGKAAQMDFRTVSTAPEYVEWQIRSQVDIAPTQLIIKAIAYIADPTPVLVTYDVVRPGANLYLQNKYWFMVEREDLASLVNIASSAAPQAEIRVTFPNTIYSDVIASIGELKMATSAFVACVRLMPP